jgi:thiamine-monophosphate kinase
VPPDLRRLHLDPLRLALHGGEDYELLFTVPKRRIHLLPSAVDGVPLAVIGEITRGKEIVLVSASGKERLLLPGGWDPFKS